METNTVWNDTLFWTFIAFALAFIIHLLIKYRNSSTEGKVLFQHVKYDREIDFIARNYVHFGLRDDHPKMPSQDPYGKKLEFSSTQSCGDCNNSPIIIEEYELTHPPIFTEGGNPPSSTISTPTGQDPPKKEGLGLNILCKNQYIPATNIFEYSNFLNEHINFSEGTSYDPVKIAIIDTGINVDGKSEKFRSGLGDVCPRFSAPDVNGHGTFVYYFTKVGLAKKGINNYQIYPYNVADEKGELVYSRILCAMVDAAEKGITNINLSFGFYVDLPEFRSFIDLFLDTYQSRNIKIVCSAGNVGREIAPFDDDLNRMYPNRDMPHPPSYYHNTYPNIFQITAFQLNLTNKGVRPEICSFTNYEKEINFASQGCFKLKLNGENCLIEGTSFAAPFFLGYYSDLSLSELNDYLNSVQRDRTIPTWGRNHKIVLPSESFIPNMF